MSRGQCVLTEKRGRAFWITINRPEKRNAINASVIAGIRDGYRDAHADPEVRAIIVTGAGETAFCAGADLQPDGGFAFDLSKPNLAYADLLREARSATVPTIARINGVCMAGGIGLACMTDFAIAVEETHFGLPEVRVGVFPMQVVSLLLGLAPARIVREWVISGEPFTSQEAKSAGLVNYVVPRPELDEKVAWLIDRIADKSPTAIRRGKYAMRAIESMSFDEAMAYTEGQIVLASLTEDAKEGLAAFNQKRRPVWTGR
jgi:methylglutaconyl-CoA hydratase